MWRKYLLELNDIISSLTSRESTYRHGIKAIPINRIAQQYYCEMKVELSYKYGDVETEDKKVGKEIHEQVLATEKVDTQTLVERISTLETYLTSFPLIAEIEGATILGIPDLIVFYKGKPVFLIELKTTKSNVFRIWSNEVIQAKMYALALEHIGFDCSNLDLVVVKIRRDNKKELSDDLLEHMLVCIELDINKDDFFFRKYPYNREDALKDLEWAKGYWLNQRDPIPTRKLNKCLVCEYKDFCPIGKEVR